jgi:flagellar biosynthesis protein FlhG
MTSINLSVVSKQETATHFKPHKSHKIIMVASGKGGVGKTWFSVSIAHALAQEGKKVLLFDGDLGLANIDIQLGLMPDKDLSTVIAGQATLDQVVAHFKPAGIDIIAGRSGCSALSSISPERLAYLHQSIKMLALAYDIVIMDLGAGIGGTVRTLSRIANECLVIITEEPTSLTDAYAFIKLTRKTMPDMPLKLVVNQAESIEAGQNIYEIIRRSCENFLSFSPPAAGIIRRDPLVRDAIRHQSPFLTRHVNANAAEDVRKVMREIVGG